MDKEKASLKSSKSGNIHDLFVRAVFANVELVADFLRQYADPKLLKQLDLRKIKSETNHFSEDEGRERIADMIFSIPLKKRTGSLGIIFVFEHSSKRRRSLGLQLLKYLAAIWNRIFSDAKNRENATFFLPAPLLIVLHNGSRPLADRPTLEKMVEKVPGTERFIPKFEYDLVDLPALRVEELGDAPLLHVILELLKRATDGTLDDVKTQILGPLAAIRDDEQTREWIKRILRYMDDVLVRQNKRLNQEKVSRMIKPIYEERSEEMSKTLFGEIEAKGLARGLAEGEARGKAEAVVTFLKARFGELPMKTSDRVLKISDLVVLDSLTQLAATCDSLDTFAKALD